MIDRVRLGLTSGFVSVAIWIVVFSPQIWECYVLQSGEGLSPIFLTIWLLGDITGVIGALAQHLSITISLLGLYYTFCDILLLYLIFYYRYQRKTYPEKFEKVSLDGEEEGGAEANERTPLLANGTDDAKPDESSLDTLKRWARANSVTLVAYSLALVFIVAVGLIAWFSTSEHGDMKEDEEWSTPGQIVGWISAALYLGSRIPQIAKNTKTKCQGLSLMMFCFSVIGNLTYCGAILFPSTAPNHVYLNFSWLVGAAGTIFLDFIVLGQFVYYHKERNEQIFVEGGEGQSGISGI